ncbi:SCO family protein [Fulvivirga sedimenti]|uniref:SCO family protein n=1 Tax=Fulvivirga sedimenti TaxID=2879465 RepID=A0A9X1HX22_9BACT|nr:SCO family protein [Fulvivirga sedimenti]MCA6078044.1 SCO family protein [Fulvivirga sedimenti]
MKRNKFIFGLVFVIGICAVSCSNEPGNEEDLPILGRKEIDGTDTIYHTIAEFKFVDQDSNFVTNETFEDKIYVADFFFTSCPTICPIMKTQMLRVYEEFRDDPEIGILSHSIDPTHDTVALLHEFAKDLGVTGNQWRFVTGDKEKIFEIGQKSYIVTAAEDSTEPGGYIHSGAFILVDKERRIRGIYDGTKPDQVDRLMNDIKRLKKEYNG